MKRQIKLLSIIIALCMLAILTCGCKKGGVTVTANEITGKVTEFDGKTITVEIGAQSAGRTGNFPGNNQGNGGFLPPDGFNPQGGMTPPDGNMPQDGMTPPDGNMPQDGAPSGDAMPSDGSSDDFTEEDNKENGFGGWGGFGEIGGERGRADMNGFVGTGVTIELSLAGNVTITDESGNAAEIKVGDTVVLKLNSDMKVVEIGIRQ